MVWLLAVNFGAAADVFAECSVLSQVFENHRRIKACFSAEDSSAGTIRRISKFGQIARENRR
jgi:hypothetical protein